MRARQGCVSRKPRVIFWRVAGTFLLYGATAPVIARLTRQAVAVAPVWNPQAVYPLWSRAVVLLFGLSGVAIALFVPAVAWALALAEGRLRAAALFPRAFLLNLIQSTVFISMWKASAGIVPTRPVFIAWQALVATIGLVVMFRTRDSNAIRPVDNWRPLLIGGLLLLVLLPAFLWGKTFVEDGSGDGTEAFEFSRSLATHQLPNWDLENGYYGFYPAFMLFAYPTQLSFIAIGETEAAQRLPVFFYLVGIYLVLAELVRRRRRRLAGTEILLLAGAAVFFVVYHAHHSTYELVTDLAELTGTDTFFTFLATSALYALVTRQRLWWGLFALCGSMALSAGLPFALLFLLGRLAARPPRLTWTSLRSHVFDALAFGAPWAGYHLFVSVYSRFHPLGVTKWALGNMFNQYPLQLNSAVAVSLALNFAIVVAVVPFLGLGFVAGRDKIARMIGVPVIGYFVLLVLFGRTNPHYLIPVSLFPAAILLRALAAPNVGRRRRTVGHVGYGATLVALTILVLPADRTPHTAFREFGARTLMLYDSYPGVVDAAGRLLQRKPELYVQLPNGKPAFPWQRTIFGVAGETPSANDRYLEGSFDDVIGPRSARGADALPWGLSLHLWVRYSDKTPVAGRDYDQVLAAAHLAPPQLRGFSRRDLPDGWVLFYRPEQSIFAALTPTDP
jgi:hypothetical protein